MQDTHITIEAPAVEDSSSRSTKRRQAKWWAMALAVLAVLVVAVLATAGVVSNGGERQNRPADPPATQLIPFVTHAPPGEGPGGVDG